MKNRPKATSTLRIEDGRVVAMEWTMPPGAETGWHKHGRDYIVVRANRREVKHYVESY
jgi:quercetin dioxygenase-like cupin family protein